MGRAKNSLTRESVSSTPVKFRYSATYDSSSFLSNGITTGSGVNYPYSVDMSSQQMEDMNRYRSVKQLYYQQSISASLNTGSYWDPVWQSTAASGTNDATVYSFPTQLTASVVVFAVPSSQFGEQISRNSFAISASDSAYLIKDDGNGNLFDSLSSNQKVGNLFYAQGVAVITDQSYANPSVFTGSYFLSFTSEITMYQNEVRCLVNENDFNCTLNPSANKAGTTGSYIDAVTGSDFHPYFTTVGLYNDADELLVVGKMSRPYPVPQNSDVTIVVRWDS